MVLSPLLRVIRRVRISLLPLNRSSGIHVRPSAVTSEQFFSARNMMAPGFMNNAAATKIARISNLQADAPRYSGQIDILA